MSNTIRIKRSTATAAPTTLANAELAFSENSEKLFIGVGTGGAGGSATSIVAIGGPGAYATLDTAPNNQRCKDVYWKCRAGQRNHHGSEQHLC